MRRTAALFSPTHRPLVRCGSCTRLADRAAASSFTGGASALHHAAAPHSSASSFAGVPPRQCDVALLDLLRTAVPLPSTDDLVKLLHGAKNEQEVERIMALAFRHHLCGDAANGHGFRVAVLQALTSAAPRTRCIGVWFDTVDRFRRLGFRITRTFATEGFTTLRLWLAAGFEQRGRSPHLVVQGLSYWRELLHWSLEDGTPFDHVLYTRLILLLTMMASFLDRQNVYRSSFPSDFVKRDGVVVEWVLTAVRSTDFDEAVLQCDACMEEVLELLRREIPSRPTFSVLYRLVDYYFTTDNVDKMLAVMEDAVSYGVPIAESSTAKLMQLACAMNFPNVPQLFIRWRAALPQCVLATPDISRLLFYHGRSGGGFPCPHCGEPFNHRNTCVYVWLETPPHQRNCPVLQLGRIQKGEHEERTDLPQQRDWSREAWDLWAFSTRRSIPWGAVEWRGFLLCGMFPATAEREKGPVPPPPSRHQLALDSLQLLDANLPPAAMDDFLRATYVRFLRHHAPQRTAAVLQGWEAAGLRLSPMVLQEALMAIACTEEKEMEDIKGRERSAAAQRHRDLLYVWRIVLQKKCYVTPFTRRLLERRRAELLAQRSAGAAQEADTELLQTILEAEPPSASLLDLKDSASDFALGVHKRNVYTPTTP